MLEFYRTLRKPAHRKVLFALWFDDYTLPNLADKVRMDDVLLQGILKDLYEDDLIVQGIDPHLDPISLDPDVRRKVSRSLSRLIVSGTFAVVGFALTRADQTFNYRQNKRIRKRLQTASIEAEKHL